MKKYYSPEAYRRKLDRNNKYRKIIDNPETEPKMFFVFVPTEKIKKPMPLFEILDVLRKDVKHYLWGLKSVKEWTENDWIEFNKLKSA